jgi:hypothetical protein
MQRLRVPLITFAISAVLLIITAFTKDITIVFWTGYVLSNLTILAFQLSTLTLLFDLLDVQPGLGVTLLVLSLAVFVASGLLLRWVFMESFIYWTVSTIFPALCGGLYVIDTIQHSSDQMRPQ